MRKAVIIAGLIITIIGLSLIVMTSLNVANINKIVSTYTCYPANCNQTPIMDSNTLTNGQISLFHGIVANLYQPYSQVLAYVGILNPNSFPVAYTVQLLAQGQAISTVNITVGARQSGSATLSSFFTSGLPGIPVLMEPRYGAVPNINFELKFSSSSSSGFSVYYLGEIVNKIIIPFLLILTIAGLAITTIPLVLNYRQKSAARRPRPLTYQSSLYEPTLAGSAQQKSQKKPLSRSTTTSSVRPTGTKGPVPSKMASNVARCRSCQKPIPSKSQYCPHCYTRQ